MSKQTDKTNLSTSTIAVHAGGIKAEQGEPLSQSPVFASTFHLSGELPIDNYQYGRFSHPNWDALEHTLAELEGGKSLVFPSGMAAGAAIMTALLEPGDTVVLPQDGYQPMVTYANTYLAKFGVKVETVATLDLLSYDYTGVKLVFIESPSNPLLDVVDIKKLADTVHQKDGLLAIDNTTCTPIGQQPLALGADISMCADTKALNGHSDALFGHVACKDEGIYEQIALWRKLSGSICGPMETFLVQRGLATLDMRLERMCNNALKVAEYLKAHDKVKSIRYPGLASDPSHQLATAQMYYLGFIISFDLGSLDAANQFLQSSNLIIEATSFGSVHTMGERRARWGTDDVPAGLVRLSVGCEKVDDLLADIELALEVV